MRILASRDRRASNGAHVNDARRLEELDAIHETALMLAERLDTQSLLRTIVERAASLVGTEHGYLNLCDADGAGITVRIGTGVFASHVGQRLALGEGVAGRVAKSGEAIAVADYGLWPGRSNLVDPVSYRATVGVPLRGPHGIAGVIGLAYVESVRVFGVEEIAVLERFGRLASIALENARLYEDAQTELEQRRRTEEELLDTVGRLSRSELELKRAHAETIRRLADAAEFRDAETGRHTERMSRYCELLAHRLGLDEERCALIRAASPLHDIGKIAVPDDVLLKPGPLTPDERASMRRHAEIGHRLLSGSSSELLAVAATIAWTHHERYDGSGYPRGLVGEAIPLEGRIAAVADVFDALTTDRVYRAALSVSATLELMQDGRGTQFDPFVLDLFIEHVATAAVAHEALEALEAPEEDPLLLEEPSRPAHEERVVEGDLQTLDGRSFKRACRAAERAFERATGREAIELALEALVAGYDGRVLASVYGVEHGRLWLIAQRGYQEVRDGFTLEQGVMGRAVRTGTIQVVGDVRSDHDFIAATGGVVCAAAVPFQSDGGVAGALNVEMLDMLLPRSAGAALAPLASLLGSRVGELQGELGTDVGELARLCVHASSLRGVAAIAEFATRTAGRMLDLQSAQLDMRRDDDPHPRLVSFWRPHDSGLEPFGAEELQTIEGLVESRSGAAYSIVDARKARLVEAGSPRLLSMPFRVAGISVGTITGRLSENEPSHERLEAATLFAQHAAALIDVAYALRREQRAAITDPLTGLLNRRGFEERFQEELQRATRDEQPTAVIICDCDGLKTMNDVRGHEQGDALLEIVASCFRTVKRASDVASRYGGDEFALLLPNADVETALAVAERIRAAIAAETLAGFRLSGSFGVAAFPLHGSTTTDLIRAADDALYRAKQRGGDEIAAGTPEL